MQKAIECKKRLDEESRKYHLLKNTSAEYKTKLQSQSQSIEAVKFQQYQAFLTQLEKAIVQQNDAVSRCRTMHLKWLKDLEVTQKKIEGLNKLILDEKSKRQINMDKKETQQATDLFNQFKRQ